MPSATIKRPKSGCAAMLSWFCDRLRPMSVAKPTLNCMDPDSKSHPPDRDLTHSGRRGANASEKLQVISSIHDPPKNFQHIARHSKSSHGARQFSFFDQDAG